MKIFKNYIKEYRRLKYLAYHDSLTGLLNRNWLYDNAKYIYLDYVYFIDINDLHQVNKKGHHIGDEYIKDVVKSIVLIKGEILVRYAGDEFLLFSDRISAINTNKNITVGVSEISKTFNCVEEEVWISIHKENKLMLENKIKKI